MPFPFSSTPMARAAELDTIAAGPTTVRLQVLAAQRQFSSPNLARFRSHCSDWQRSQVSAADVRRRRQPHSRAPIRTPIAPRSSASARIAEKSEHQANEIAKVFITE